MNDEDRVMAAALELERNRDRATDWYRTVPIPEFNYRTTQQLLADHQAGAVLSYLASVRGGSTG